MQLAICLQELSVECTSLDSLTEQLFLFLRKVQPHLYAYIGCTFVVFVEGSKILIVGTPDSPPDPEQAMGGLSEPKFSLRMI